MDVTQALLKLAPNASFSVKDENYDEITWFSLDIPKPTREQVEAKVEELKAAEPMRRLRVHRDKLLAETDWVTMRAYSTKTDVPIEWVEYQQALRELPNISTPVLDPSSSIGISGVNWPVKPS